jgi:hypothetical protein
MIYNLLILTYEKYLESFNSYLTAPLLKLSNNSPKLTSGIVIFLLGRAAANSSILSNKTSTAGCGALIPYTSSLPYLCF